MAYWDTKFFTALFKPKGGIDFFKKNKGVSHTVVNGLYFAKKPTLQLVRFLLPAYRAYQDDDELVEEIYKRLNPDLSKINDVNIRRLLTQKEPVLPEQTHQEFENISQLPAPAQEQAQQTWVSKLQAPALPVPGAPAAQETLEIPISTPETVPAPGFVKDVSSRGQIIIKKLIDSYLTPIRLASLVTGAVGAVTGFGIAGPIGAVVGGGGGLAVPTIIQNGGGEAVLNAGQGALNTGENLLNNFTRLDSFSGKFSVFSKTGLIIIIALILGLTFFISGAGGPATNLEASPLSTSAVVGVNIHYLVNKGPERINHILSYLSSSCGVSVIRIWGTGSAQELKQTLDLGSKYNVKFIIPLADFANRTPNDSLIPLESGKTGSVKNPTGWYRDGYKEAYQAHVKDTVTFLKDHLAISAWELANEPHCAAFSDCPEAYTKWVKDMSELIKSIDTNHLVSIGTQANADFQLGDSVNDGQYEKINSIPTIGALTGHYYDGSKDAIKGVDDFKTQKDLMLKEIAIAKKLNKPFYVGEAGFLCQPGNKECQLVQTDAQSLQDRAALLKKELDDIFNAGATGYLIWQYSDRITDPIETDTFSFFEGDPVCSVLKEFSQKAAGTPLPPAGGGESIASVAKQIADQLQFCTGGTFGPSYHCWDQMGIYDQAGDPGYLQCTEFLWAAFDKAGFLSEINLIRNNNAADWPRAAQNYPQIFSIFYDARLLLPGDIISLGGKPIGQDSGVNSHLAIVIEKGENVVRVAQAATDSPIESWNINLPTGELDPLKKFRPATRMYVQGFIRLIGKL